VTARTYHPLPPPRAMSEQTPKNASLSDVAEPPPKRKRSNCGCVQACHAVISMIPAERSSLKDAASLEVLRAAFTIPGYDKLAGFCHSHLRLLVSVVGLKNSFSGSSRESLVERATVCYENRHNLLELRRRHCDWFIVARQTNDVRLALGGAKYADLPMPSIVIDSERIFARYASAGHWECFRRDGTVNIDGVFSYLYDAADVTEMIDLEFDLYRHHYHAEGNPGKRLGWSRNMWYSLVQQIVRQDPVYYCLMAAARPDRNWRLISYPYYTKDTDPGESTGFAHLDLNLQRFIDCGKGGDIVQGALALDDETEKNCTVLVPGFQDHIQEWWHDLRRRGCGETTGCTTDVKDIYTREDQNNYGEFQPVPCNRGDIRITLPQIIHGSTSKCDTRRRVVFPWFTGIGADHEILDNPESETWSQIAACHRDLVPCELSPSGRSTSAYQRGPHFKAAILLSSQSPISDALIGRRRWSSPLVHSHASILFGQDDDAAYELVSQIRCSLLESYRTAWKELQVIEKQLYGRKSFFYMKENNIHPLPADGYSDSDVDSDFDKAALHSSDEG